MLRGVIVHEPPLRRQLSEGGADGPLRVVLDLIRSGDHAGAAERFVEDVALGPGAWGQLPEQVRATMVENAPTYLDEELAPDSRMVDEAGLARYAGPVLITSGTQSPPVFQPVFQHLSRLLPGASRVEYTGAGHIPHVTHPAEFVTTVTDFIESAPRGAPVTSLDVTPLEENRRPGFATGWLARQQVVLHREKRRRGPSGGADLGVDVLDVVLRCAPRDHQRLGDLFVRQPPSQQAQHLHLPLAEPARPARPDRYPWLPRGLDHGPHAVRVEPPGPRLLGQPLRGLVGSVGGAVGPFLCEGLEGVGCRENPSRDRDRSGAKTRGGSRCRPDVRGAARRSAPNGASTGEQARIRSVW